jgi:hypothetical protein
LEAKTEKGNAQSVEKHQISRESRKASAVTFVIMERIREGAPFSAFVLASQFRVRVGG